MRGVLLILAVLFLAGCTSATPEATPTPVATPSSTIEATPEPTIEATPTPEPEVNCFEITDESINNAIAIRDCFMEQNKYVECAYTMISEARKDELTSGKVTGWPVKLYAKAYDCAKEAENQGVTVPDKLSLTILGYYDCYQSDAVCGVTSEQLDALINELEAVR